MATILSVCALFSATFVFQAKTTDFFAQKTVAAETQTSVAELIAPNSYMEYLPLISPADVAVCENYTAIADGAALYVYDTDAKIYRTYKHTTSITKLAFDKEDNLYFLDASTYLRVLNPGNLTVTETGFVCSNFTLDNDVLYYTNTSASSSQIRKAEINDLQISLPVTLLDKLSLSPTLAFYDNELYYTDGGKYLHKLNPTVAGSSTFVAAFPNEILSMTIKDDVLTCTNSNGSFSCYDLLQLLEIKESEKASPLFTQEGDFTALSLHKDSVYAINGASVREYSLKEKNFLETEIGAASSSNTRLNGATELYVFDQFLFILDNGNHRICIYDTAKKAFLTPIAIDFNPKFIASDGKTLLVANAIECRLLSLQENNHEDAVYTFKSFEGEVSGVTQVYGKYYFTTDKNQFLCLSQTDGAWRLNATQKTATYTPNQLCADVYGNLYVRCENRVYRYTEKSFLSTQTSNDLVIEELPQNTKKIAADYGASLYALGENKIYEYRKNQNGYTQATVFDVATPTVCGVTPSVCAFAFSTTEDAVYLLDTQHYLIKQNNFSLPTMTNVPVDGADKAILNNTSTDVTLVQIQENALMVEFDLNQLQDAKVFPYVGYKRNGEAKNAVQLGKTDEYVILSVYDERNRQYATYLVRNEYCSAVDKAEYFLSYKTPQTGYLSNDVALYRQPFLSLQMQLCDMERGCKLEVLGEVKLPDRTYYLVSYGEAKTLGYVPSAYVTPTDGKAPILTPSFGEKQSNTGAVGRLVYLLLGFGVICILTDYLILRKPKDDNENKDDENPSNYS